MPSAACTVKDGAGSPQTTPPYALVTPGNTVTIALADVSGASTWTIVCLYTDETSDAASVNAGLTVNSGAKTATFTAPTAGKAYIFQSQINNGVDANGTVVVEYTKTFKVATATSGGLIVGAVNETYEHSATFGHTAVQNAAVRAYGSASGGAVGSRYPLDAFDRHAWLLKETALPLVDGGTAAQNLDTLAGTAPIYGDTGIVSPGIRFAATSLNYVRTSVAGTSSNPSATQLTVHGWIRSRAAAGVPQRLICKGYNTTGNTPAAAPESICLVIQSTNRLSCQTNIGGAGGSLKFSIGTGYAYIPINVWTHVGATYNAGTLKLYVNGTEVLSDATWPVSLDYNGASSGYWYIGGSSLTAGSATSFDGAMNDWRVCDGVARSAAYMREVYLTALGYAGGVYVN